MPWDGGWHMGWMWIGWLLAIVVIGGGLWFLVNGTRGGSGGPGESPEQALKRRYARGEIDRETYERMLDEIRR